MRPGVKEKKILNRKVGITKLRKAIGQTQYEGITVEGHCIGIQSRTWRIPPQPANYVTAYAAAKAVIKAGKMRPIKLDSKGNPIGKLPKGVFIWWKTGSKGEPGHVMTSCGSRGWNVLGNIGFEIKRVPIRTIHYEILGWSYPGDVPGWV